MPHSSVSFYYREFAEKKINNIKDDNNMIVLKPIL